MALRTIGTAATTTLQGFVVGTNDLIPADVASLLNAVNDDQKTATAPVSALNLPNCYVQTGGLIIPNRGHLRLFAGDFVAWDTQTGWPIVVSARAAAGAGYVHT
jgi:hypothetical protein